MPDSPPTPPGLMDEARVLIVGAGITGLLLAQALKREGVSFSIFERDPDPFHRGKGWGLTIHWALDAFLSLLPQDLIDRLPETYVDPVAVADGENGNFLFYDLQSGEARWQVPANRRLRVSRERLRKLLMEGIDVSWDKSLSSIQETSSTAITARFSDGTSTKGTQLIGCDGSRSQVRKLLCPATYSNTILPVRLLGVSATFSSPTARGMRSLDPYFLQGGDPATDAFLWFSFLDTPANNVREEKDTYECQILTSWPYRTGFLKDKLPTEIPENHADRVELMKRISDGWTSPFRDTVHAITEDTPVKTITLEDWVPKKGAWNNQNGRIWLVGDAAHAMTMFRGEAANHGITDVASLLEQLLPVVKAGSRSPDSLKRACEAYEDEMITRTRPAVLTSRKACLDAHDYKSINDQSPLVSRRQIVYE